MDKNWLIRTKSNHILGPVSKEKVQELYKNGSIKPDDEICSGNGFWFFLREDEMVSRFLMGNEVQGFNPVSEAKDVLTSGKPVTDDIHKEKDDITVVGGINLSMLKESPTTVVPKIEPVPEVAEAAVPEPKKKPNLDTVSKQSVAKIKKPKVQLKKQNYLSWILILGIAILFCLLYYRKRIWFSNEVSLNFSIITDVQAQEVIPQKKKLFERSVTLDDVSFHPRVGLSGFQVVSSFNIQNISCEDLGNEVHQLGIILHPPELINEKFLIKMRQCVHKMPDTHPVKRWLKSISKIEKRTIKEQEAIQFLTEVLNSRFNLITDSVVRTKIINNLVELPEQSLGERLLKSYLYLIIGNISKSDNLIQEFIQKTPYQNWKGFPARHSIYHKLATENIEQIILKLSAHPADRRVYHLLTQYLQQFYRDDVLIALVSDNQGPSLESRLELKFIERSAPELVHYLRLIKEDDATRVNRLRNIQAYPLHEQAYWFWPFLNIDPLVSQEIVDELKKIEKDDQLWFIYLMDNEKLIDAYTKKTNTSFLPSRRQFLHQLLNEQENFMLSLFKLIEFGDIDEKLILNTINFLNE